MQKYLFFAETTILVAQIPEKSLYVNSSCSTFGLKKNKVKIKKKITTLLHERLNDVID
jgi:hypothetical protein